MTIIEKNLHQNPFAKIVTVNHLKLKQISDELKKFFCIYQPIKTEKKEKKANMTMK